MRKTREEKAITLIALIITIVVLLILAVVAINAVTGDGIIQHATNAKADYEKAQDEEKEMLSYYEEYLQTQGNLGPWKQDGNRIYMNNADGEVEVELEIGSYVSYNPAIDKDGNSVTKTYTSYGSLDNENNKNGRAGGFDGDTNEDGSADIGEDQTFTNNYTGYWQVLGIENGYLMLISSSNIINTYYLKGKEGYQYGVEELDAICSIYGYGKGALEARSIKIEDINKITGYNPETAKWQSNTAFEYGATTEYSISENSKIHYKILNGSADIDSDYTECVYFENGEWNTLGVDKETLSIKSEAYKYYPETLSEFYDSEKIGILEGSTIYNMLFAGTEADGGHPYLLSSRIVGGGGCINYGLRQINDKGVGYCLFFRSYGLNRFYTNKGIRVVVKLSKDVTLTKNEDNDSWEIN